MDKLDTLDSIFYRRILRIPDYQRGYAWGLKQLQDFWEDLINLPDGKNHYTGMLSIKRLSADEVKGWKDEAWAINDYVPFHVVDGQQRLTTFIIFLNSIINEVRKFDKNKGKKDSDIVFDRQGLNEIVKKYIVVVNLEYPSEKIYKFGYEVDNPSFNYLRQEILGDKLNREIENSFYTYKLNTAKVFFDDKLKELKKNVGNLYEEELQKLYRTLTSRLLFVVQEIEDFDVNVAFETMNNRGLSLSNLEKLKNRLIYLTTLYSSEELPVERYESIRRTINDSWKEIYKQLGKNANSILPDDDFLQNHWRLFYHYSRSSEHNYVTEILEERFTFKSVVAKDDKHLTPLDIDNYVTDLSNMAKYWYYSYNPYDWKEIDKEEQDWIARLNRLEMAYFRPVIISAYMNEDCDKQERISLMKSIERFVFILFRCKTGFTSQYKMSEYIKLAKELKNKTININQLIDRINETTNYYSKDMTSFIERIDKLFDGNGGGFYSWEGLKYFLYEYETSLVNTYGNPKISADLFFLKNEKDRYSVEHVFPQTNKTVYYWANTYRFFSDEQKNMLCGSLGNLLPLSASVNATMLNYEYAIKKNGKDTYRRGYKNGSYSELEVYNHNNCSNDWTYNDIKDRGLRLLDFFENHWHVELGTEEEKIKLLHIDFINEININMEVLKPFESKYTVTKQSGSKMLRTEFWKEFNEALKDANFSDYFSDESLPTGYQAWFPKIGGTRVQLFIDIQSNLIIRLFFGRKELFDALRNNKNEIDECFGIDSKWDMTKAANYRILELFNVKFNYKDKESWNELIEWLSNKVIEVNDYFTEMLEPYDNVIQKQVSIRYTEDEFINRKKSTTEETKKLFRELKEKILSKYPDTNLYFTQHYAAFATKQTYLELHIMKDCLELHVKDTGIKSSLGNVLPPEYLWSLNYRLYLKDEAEFDEAFKLIDASYGVINA